MSKNLMFSLKNLVYQNFYPREILGPLSSALWQGLEHGIIDNSFISIINYLWINQKMKLFLK